MRRKRKSRGAHLLTGLAHAMLLLGAIFMVLPMIFMSFGIFLMRQHVSSAIPTDYLEAARIDGASEWWILVRIIAPLSVSAFSAIGIFAFIQAWAAFIWPLLVANDQLHFNMEVGLTAF